MEHAQLPMQPASISTVIFQQMLPSIVSTPSTISTVEALPAPVPLVAAISIKAVLLQMPLAHIATRTTTPIQPSTHTHSLTTTQTQPILHRIQEMQAL